jgi:hypothetical protein
MKKLKNIFPRIDYIYQSNRHTLSRHFLSLSLEHSLDSRTMPGKKWSELNDAEKKLKWSEVKEEYNVIAEDRRFLEAELESVKRALSKARADISKAKVNSFKKGFEVCAGIAAKAGVEIKYRSKKSKPEPERRIRHATMRLDSDSDDDEDEGSDITAESVRKERSGDPGIPSVHEVDEED